MDELTRITRKLAEAKVEFVIAGGLAVILRGSSLMTRDVDAVCKMTPENLTRVYSALESLHPVHRMSPQKPAFTREQAAKPDWKNLHLSTDWGQLDCLGEVKGVGDYEACLAVSEAIKLEDVTIRVLTLDALIAAKRAMGRPKDLHAVLELEAIREGRIPG